MKIAGIIPARYASQRFPGKPLALIDGQPMIRRVYEQALKAASLSSLAVATDDERIAEVVVGFGGRCIMTSDQHPSGTDRCAEAAAHFEDAEAIINIQGDEPRIHPEQIDQVAALLEQSAEIATLARHVTDFNEAYHPNIVKVVTDLRGRALYFSRSPIPSASDNGFLHHVGIYGFRTDILMTITRLKPGPLEIKERLEQLRWLENGYNIMVGITKLTSISVDTPEDLKKL